jgi:RNA polymerase sigma factor (sigma-70 family)
MTRPPRSDHPPRAEPWAPRQDTPEPEAAPPHVELWSQHAADLTRYATLLVGPHDAHDIVSIAFHRVTCRLDEAQSIPNVRAYLMRSVTNAATDQHRSQRRRQQRDLRAAAGSPNSTVEASGTELDIRRAVAQLSVQQRAVVYFTYWEDLDSREVARLLDIAPATVRRHLVRARFQLRKELS